MFRYVNFHCFRDKIADTESLGNTVPDFRGRNLDEPCPVKVSEKTFRPRRLEVQVIGRMDSASCDGPREGDECTERQQGVDVLPQVEFLECVSPDDEEQFSVRIQLVQCGHGLDGVGWPAALGSQCPMPRKRRVLNGRFTIASRCPASSSPAVFLCGGCDRE